MYRTRQEIFDLAWNGLKAQGFEQSKDKPGSCLFRGPNGAKCAIGHCIPDDEYHPLMDGDGSFWDAAFEAAGVSEEDRSFAEDLQGAHDFGDTPEIMEECLRAFAAEHRLTLPTSEF